MERFADPDNGEARPRVAPGTTRADFYYGSYCMSAEISTGDRRLLDVLRDATRQYLDVRRLCVGSFGGTDHPAAYAHGLIHKHSLDWVAVRAEPARGQGRLYGSVKKSPVQVFIGLPKHRIQGTVFVDSGSTDPVVFFLRQVEKSGERFMPIVSAVVTSESGSTQDVGLAIVNRT